MALEIYSKHAFVYEVKKVEAVGPSLYSKSEDENPGKLPSSGNSHQQKESASEQQRLEPKVVYLLCAGLFHIKTCSHRLSHHSGIMHIPQLQILIHLCKLVK